ncbi:hypothetical protein [Pectobacterium brasiliense]
MPQQYGQRSWGVPRASGDKPTKNQLGETGAAVFPAPAGINR